MFDSSRRDFVRRKNFRQYGPEDRTRYTYQGDLFNVFSKKNNEELFKYVFENESPSHFLHEQNAEAAGPFSGKTLQDIKSVYHYLFEEALTPNIGAGLSASFGVQVKQLTGFSEDNDSILEIGAGNGLLAPLFIKLSQKSGITYTIVEAIPQHLVVQQSVLKYFSIVHNTFSYCSSIERYKSLRDRQDGNILLHIGVWDLPQIDFPVDTIVANNLFDQITQNDFDEYLSQIGRISGNDTKLSLWGGMEKGGVSDLYLFGYGTYHNYNVIEKLRKSYDLVNIQKDGSEFNAVFDCGDCSKNEQFIEGFEGLEKTLIKEALNNISLLWVDDNATYLNRYAQLFENADLVSATSSVNTAPLPGNIKREHIRDHKLVVGARILIFSYRWVGVVNFFLEQNWQVGIEKLSDRAVVMTLKK